MHLFACIVAEQALNAEVEAGRTPNAHCYKAIKAKRGYLKGAVTKEELIVAYSAAWSEVKEQQNRLLSEMLLQLLLKQPKGRLE